jgi:hypothetical protein
VDSDFCDLLKVCRRQSRRKLDEIFFRDMETGMFIAMDESRTLGKEDQTSTFFV